MKNINKIINRIVNIPINCISFIISIIIPRSPGIIVFGGWFSKRFADNSRYLFMYCNDNKEKLGFSKVVWITDNDNIYKELKDKNIQVYKKNTLKSIWYHLRSKYHVIDQNTKDINAYFSIGATRVQLWHGVGFKRISKLEDIPNYKSYKYKIKYYLNLITIPGGWYRYVFLSTSKFATDKIFNLSFRLWENKVIEFNYPRNMYLLDTSENWNSYLMNEEILIQQKIKQLKENNKKIVLYLPTFRNEANIYGVKTKIYPLNMKDNKQFEDFNKFLIKNNLIFLCKFHLAGDKEKNVNTENFINLNATLDIYSILKEVDLLITDYSSVYADFLFVDKPVIFYPYDLETYKNEDRGFLFDYNDITPGEKVFDIDELEKAILHNLKNDEFKLARKKVKEIYFGESYKHTFDLLVNEIKNI